MSTRTISISGARGGHGASTVAAALALHGARHHPTELIAHDREGMAALLGLVAPITDDAPVAIAPQLDLGRRADACPALVVIDAGSRLEAPQSYEADERYVVVRGPCYLALRSLVRAEPGSYDGVILVNEPGRSLRASDVAEVLGVPVVAEVAHDASVARSIDAGVLPARIHRLPALASLRALALDPPRRSRSRHAVPPVTTRPTYAAPHPTVPERTPEESGTDWPGPLFSGPGGRGPGRVTRIGARRGRRFRPSGWQSIAQHRQAPAGRR